ncbi:MAG: hypothetical protein BLM47_06715 [Candidatus Reconcilbacillus cellulovorans]|uniref:Uncharacterized protein n=1 Tax=Candidatus Reconcilbacillus cellulovorans TaxID=1906605 RepID=A0A2A6E175_9BACL|nr:MAG: hypothetical protein BLM47_06715 [Candidatus Reconcilbacillus cellulovorans]
MCRLRRAVTGRRDVDVDAVRAQPHDEGKHRFGQDDAFADEQPAVGAIQAAAQPDSGAKLFGSEELHGAPSFCGDRCVGLY